MELRDVAITPNALQGGAVTLSGTVLDFAHQDIRLVVDWGDGTPPVPYDLGQGSEPPPPFAFGVNSATFSEQHTYQDAGTHQVDVYLNGDDHASVLYGADANGDLFTLDPTSGAATRVGALPVKSDFAYILNPLVGMTESFPRPVKPARVADIVADNVNHRAWLQYLGIVSYDGQGFDPATASAVGGLVPDAPADTSFQGLAYVNGTLYAAGNLGPYENQPSHLFTLDPVTGQATLIGPTGTNALTGLAYDAQNDILYAVRGTEYQLPVVSDLMTVDRATGQATPVFSLGFQAESLQFGPDGQLFAGSDGGSLYRIDPVAHTVTLVGPTGYTDAITGLALVDQPNATLSVTVTPVPQVSNVTLTGPAVQGQPVTLSGTLSGGGDQGYTLVVNWGDGAAPQTFTYGPGVTAFSEQHAYKDAGSYSVKVYLNGDPLAGAVMYGADAGNNLFTLDLTTGAATPVGTLPTTYHSTLTSTQADYLGSDPHRYHDYTLELAVDNVHHRGWVTHALSDFGSHIDEFDLDTGAAVGNSAYLGKWSFLNAMAFVGDTLYAYADLQLLILDPDTGTTTPVGAPQSFATWTVDPVTGNRYTTDNVGGAMIALAYDARNDILYGATTVQRFIIQDGHQVEQITYNLVTVDRTTGVFTTVMSTDFAADSLQFGPDGQLYAGSGDGKLYRIDPAAHTTSLVGATGYSDAITGLALVDQPSARLTVTVAAVDPNVQLAEKLYAKTLGRLPGTGEGALWAGALAAGMSPNQAAQGFVGSAEFLSNLVAGYYTRYLGRDASPAELNLWKAALQSGMTYEQMTVGFLNSAEYFAHTDGTSKDFVQGLYQNLLGRAANGAEVASWVQVLSQGLTPQQVIGDFLASLEYCQRVVNEAYQHYLGRPADAGAAGWVSQLVGAEARDAATGQFAGGALQQLQIGILSSAEFTTGLADLTVYGMGPVM
jgi:hypothetical protein